MTFPQERIRNFCIIAHIDHGKSTLADRLLEATGTLTRKEMREQVLDTMDLERERGITIKSHPIRMVYRAKDGHDYLFNLIDTPGPRRLHVRSLAQPGRVRGRDSRGRRGAGHPGPDGVERVPRRRAGPRAPARDQQDRPAGGASRRSHARDPRSDRRARRRDRQGERARRHRHSPTFWKPVVARMPAPKGDRDGKLQGLIFDSFYDTYRGSVVYVRIKQGRVRRGRHRAHVVDARRRSRSWTRGTSASR